MENKQNLKLTKRMKDVIRMVRDEGYIVLVTEIWVYLSKGYENIKVNGILFFKLVDEGLFWQDPDFSHNFVLTKKGKEIKL